jgi:hypothetical protein
VLEVAVRFVVDPAKAAHQSSNVVAVVLDGEAVRDHFGDA